MQSLIPVGTAAAVAAAFNTPLAAVLFTLEEILADLHARVVGSVVIGACTSWIVLRLILGDEPLFHVPAYQLVHPLEFLIYACSDLLGGLVSTAFVKLLLWQRAVFLKAPQRWKPFTPAAGGLVVGLLALAAPGVLGVGYNLVSEALNGQMALKMMLLLLVLKLIATSTSYGSGNAGGIFGPSLFIGAMLGRRGRTGRPHAAARPHRQRRRIRSGGHGRGFRGNRADPDDQRHHDLRGDARLHHHRAADDRQHVQLCPGAEDCNTCRSMRRCRGRTASRCLPPLTCRNR